MPPPMAKPRMHQHPREEARRRLSASVVSDGERHADHAVAVALPRGGGRRQAAQRQDEQDAGDEIEEGGEIGVHVASALLLVHREHALGDEEPAEDVHRREDERDEADELARRSSRCRPPRRRPKAARRPRSPRRSRWSRTSAACAAPASPTRPRNSRRTPPARRSRGGTRTGRSRRPRRRGLRAASWSA